MSKKPVKPSGSGKTAQSSTPTNSSEQSPGESQYTKSLHRSIATLPLNRFIDVEVNKNLHALIIYGEHSEAELLEAWVNIKTEYLDTIGDAQLKLYISVLKEYTGVKALYNQVLIAIDQLTLILNKEPVKPEYVKLVKEWEVRLNRLLVNKVSLDLRDPANYIKQLKAAEAQNKSRRLRMGILAARMEELDKVHTGKTETVNQAYYVSILVNLSDDVGYQLSDNITVLEFATRVKRFKERQNSGKHGRRANR